LFSLCLCEFVFFNQPQKQIDGGETDDKIIAVHADDPEYRNYNVRGRSLE
jgi:hypothetical protein